MSFVDTLLVSEVTVATIYFAISSLVVQLIGSVHIPSPVKVRLKLLPLITAFETVLLSLALLFQDLPITPIISPFFLKVVIVIFYPIALILFLVIFVLIAWITYSLFENILG